MNAMPSSNNRLMAILIAILVVALLVLIVNVFLWLSLVRGGMMMGSMMNNPMISMNGQTMNEMMSACAEMMQDIQSP